jgi:hypothetical protein
MRQLAVVLIATLGLITSAFAQSSPTSVQRAVKGASNQDICIGAYLNGRPDCTSGPLPTIRLVTPRANGAVVVKKATINATNYKQCLALQAPGYVTIYKSRPDFSGIHSAKLEVTFPDGRIQMQEITVTVAGGRSI